MAKGYEQVLEALRQVGLEQLEEARSSFRGHSNWLAEAVAQARKQILALQPPTQETVDHVAVEQSSVKEEVKTKPQTRTNTRRGRKPCAALASIQEEEESQPAVEKEEVAPQRATRGRRRGPVVKETAPVEGETTDPPAANQANAGSAAEESLDAAAPVAVPAAPTGKPPRAPRGRKKAAAATSPEAEKQPDSPPSKPIGETIEAVQPCIPVAHEAPQTTQRATRGRARGKAAAQAPETVVPAARKTRSRTAGAGEGGSGDASAPVGGTPSAELPRRPKRQLRSTARKAAKVSPASGAGPTCSEQVDMSPASGAGTTLPAAQLLVEAISVAVDATVVDVPAKKSSRKRVAKEVMEETASSIPQDSVAATISSKKSSRKRAKGWEEGGSNVGETLRDEEPLAIDEPAEPSVPLAEVLTAPDGTAEEPHDLAGSQATPHAKELADEPLPSNASSGRLMGACTHGDGSSSPQDVDVGGPDAQDLAASQDAGTCDAAVLLDGSSGMGHAVSSHPISSDSTDVPEAAPPGGDDMCVEASSPMEENSAPRGSLHMAETPAHASPASQGPDLTGTAAGAEASPAEVSCKESPVELAPGTAAPLEEIASSPGDVKCDDIPAASSDSVADVHESGSGASPCKVPPSSPGQPGDSCVEPSPAQPRVSLEGDSPGQPQTLEEVEAPEDTCPVDEVQDVPRVSSPGDSKHLSLETAELAQEVEDEGPGLEKAVPEAQPVVLQERKPGGLGANLVSTVRSFLPFVSNNAADTAAAAGKAHVKVKALEAAEAAKRKEAAKAAQRAKLKEELERQKAERTKVRDGEQHDEAQRRKDMLLKKDEEAAARRKAKEAADKKEREDKAKRLEQMRAKAVQNHGHVAKPPQVEAADKEAERKRKVATAQQDAPAKKAKMGPPVQPVPAAHLAGPSHDLPRPLPPAASNKDTQSAAQAAPIAGGHGSVSQSQATLGPSKAGNASSQGLPAPCAAQPAERSSGAVQSYEMSPYRSDPDSDSEDENNQPRKPVPEWARGRNLLSQLMAQTLIDPDDVFQQHSTSCTLDAVFGHSDKERGSKKDLSRRGSSGNWIEDRVTWKEEMKYKKAMGYL